MNENVESLLNLSKELSDDSVEEMQLQVKKAKEAGFLIGIPVIRTKDSKLGKVVGHNETVGGFYPGSHYPVIVKFEDGQSQYGLGDIDLVK